MDFFWDGTLNFSAIRKALGLKQKEMAAMIGLSEIMWRKVEAQDRQFSEATLMVFMHAIAYYLGDEEERASIERMTEILSSFNQRLLQGDWPKASKPVRRYRRR